MAPLFNLARMTVASSGTGNITLSNAVQGFLTFDLAGCSTLAAGQQVSYAINDTNNSEIGTGTYYSSALLLTRNPANTTNGGSPIDMSNAAQVFITPQAADLYPVPVANGGTGTTTQQSSDRVLITTTSGAFTTDSALTYKTSNASLGVSNVAASSNIGATGNVTAGSQMIGAVGSAGTPSFAFTGDLNTGLFRPAADELSVTTGGVERFRFRDDGNVAIGSSGSSVANLDMTNAFAVTSSAHGILINQTVSSAVTTIYRGVYVSPTVGPFTATSTIVSIVGYTADFNSLGANAGITNVIGFLAPATLAGNSSNTYGYFSQIAAGTNRWNFYSIGTAPNYFEGATTFNSLGTFNAAINVDPKISVALGSAIPAGGSSLSGVTFGSGQIGIFFGSGVPSLAATQGSLYIRTNGTSSITRMYCATTSTGAWTPVVTNT